MNSFCQKELAPFADQIDKENNFAELRVSDCSVVDASTSAYCSNVLVLAFRSKLNLFRL